MTTDVNPCTLPCMNPITRFLDILPFSEWRILRYLIAGGTSAATNLILLYILTSVLEVWYIYSALIATSVALVVSFTLQKLWTFRNYGTERVHIQFPMHAALAGLNIGINAILLYALVEWFGLWYLFAQIVIGALLACVNYTVYKRLIFTEHV